MSRSRRGIHFNDKWQSWNSDPVPSAGLVRAFHASLQGHQPTPLIKLDDLANDIGVRAVYMKNEGSRFGLPSFKILGASWGTFRAIALKLNLPLNFNLDAVKRSLVGQNTSLFAATDGNHGRAVSRIGCWLGIPVVIHVPAGMCRSTIGFIESEGAHVCVSTGNYDQAVLEAQAAAEKAGGILVQDFAFGEYVDIPQVSDCLFTVPDNHQKFETDNYAVDCRRIQHNDVRDRRATQRRASYACFCTYWGRVIRPSCHHPLSLQRKCHQYYWCRAGHGGMLVEKSLARYAHCNRDSPDNHGWTGLRHCLDHCMADSEQRPSRQSHSFGLRSSLCFSLFTILWHLCRTM
jgi:hypothetical protein